MNKQARTKLPKGTTQVRNASTGEVKQVGYVGSVMNSNNPAFSVSMSDEQVRVCTDAVNTHDTLVAQNLALKAALEEAVDYLNTNELTSIASGSKLHTKFNDVLEGMGDERN